MEKKVRYSRQRELIRQTVRSHPSHPTADEVFAMVREVCPNISLATVYRNLNFLAEEGSIRKIPTENGPDRFDGREPEHYHLICTQCGRVIDIGAEVFREIAEGIFEENGFVMSSQRLIIYGICEDCNQKQKKEGEKK